MERSFEISLRGYLIGKELGGGRWHKIVQLFQNYTCQASKSSRSAMITVLVAIQYPVTLKDFEWFTAFE